MTGFLDTAPIPHTDRKGRLWHLYGHRDGPVNQPWKFVGYLQGSTGGVGNAMAEGYGSDRITALGNCRQAINEGYGRPRE